MDELNLLHEDGMCSIITNKIIGNIQDLYKIQNSDLFHYKLSNPEYGIDSTFYTVLKRTDTESEISIPDEFKLTYAMRLFKYICTEHLNTMIYKDLYHGDPWTTVMVEKFNTKNDNIQKVLRAFMTIANTEFVIELDSVKYRIACSDKETADYLRCSKDSISNGFNAKLRNEANSFIEYVNSVHDYWNNLIDIAKSITTDEIRSRLIKAL